MGRIRLRAGEVERQYDEGLGRFIDAEAIPCFRCGVCCQRWQPLIGPQESARLAAFVGMPVEEFLAVYARPYPFAEATYQLREGPQGGCIFLEMRDGRASCRVHPARPQACRDWEASLFRRECRDGLRALASEGVLAVAPLYDSAEDAAAFVARLRAPLPSGLVGR
jgi:Fe-S-cluster containining protein